MRYLVTGHTGFKGTWLTKMLLMAGHEVFGISLEPEKGGLFEAANIEKSMANSIVADIRDRQALQTLFAAIEPEVVIHLAAQALVLDSYDDPLITFSTNVDGTRNVLEATFRTPSVAACLVITTDKVYRNVGKLEGYVEDDPLGGKDPYSASKAMADILTQSWRASFSGPPTSIVRAGNVIGGGDLSSNRLVPDVLAALESGASPRIRNPNSVRPWQHVLDCLNGYLMTIDHMLGAGQSVDLNFGPNPDSFAKVIDVALELTKHFPLEVEPTIVQDASQLEASVLTLNSDKASSLLGWSNHLDLHAALKLTTDFRREIANGKSVTETMERQIQEFFKLVQNSRV